MLLKLGIIGAGGPEPPSFKKKKSPAGFFLLYLKPVGREADTFSGVAAKLDNLDRTASRKTNLDQFTIFLGSPSINEIVLSKAISALLTIDSSVKKAI